MKSFTAMSKNNKGITLIELVIGIAISGMILVAASSLFLAMFNIYNQSRQAGLFDDVKIDIQQELSKSIKWADTISYSANSLTIRLPNESFDRNYYLLNEAIIKDFDNTFPLTSDQIRVTKFEVEELSIDPTEVVSFQITIDLESKQFSALKDTIKLVVSQRRSEIVIEETT